MQHQHGPRDVWMGVTPGRSALANKARRAARLCGEPCTMVRHGGCAPVDGGGFAAQAALSKAARTSRYGVGGGQQRQRGQRSLLRQHAALARHLCKPGLHRGGQTRQSTKATQRARPCSRAVVCHACRARPTFGCNEQSSVSCPGGAPIQAPTRTPIQAPIRGFAISEPCPSAMPAKPSPPHLDVGPDQRQHAVQGRDDLTGDVVEGVLPGGGRGMGIAGMATREAVKRSACPAA